MSHQITEELNTDLQRHHGLIEVDGVDGKVIVMSVQVYRELLGIGSDEEYASSLKAIEEGLADIKAGRTASIDHVFRELDKKHGVHN